MRLGKKKKSATESCVRSTGVLCDASKSYCMTRASSSTWEALGGYVSRVLRFCWLGWVQGHVLRCVLYQQAKGAGMEARRGAW